jgi:hypothetical protein
MSDEKVQYLSLADLEQDNDELVGFRPNVDANEFLPPLAHAEYEGLLRFDDEHQNPDKRYIPDTTTKGEPKKYNKTTLQFMTDSNADDVANGREFGFFASTLVRKGGTTSIQAALQGVGALQSEIDTHKTRGGQCLLLNKYCEGAGSAATAEIDWEASYFDTDYTDPDTGEVVGKEYYRLRSMARFPVATEGEAEYEKSIPSADGKKRYYPWIDLDITDLSAENEVPIVVLPTTTQEQLTGRNIRRCFVRNFLRRFVTRTVIKASAATAGAAAGVSARPQAVPAPAATQAPGPAAATSTVAAGGPPRPAARPAPTRR